MRRPPTIWSCLRDSASDATEDTRLRHADLILRLPVTVAAIDASPPRPPARSTAEYHEAAALRAA